VKTPTRLARGRKYPPHHPIVKRRWKAALRDALLIVAAGILVVSILTDLDAFEGLFSAARALRPVDLTEFLVVGVVSAVGVAVFLYLRTRESNLSSKELRRVQERLRLLQSAVIHASDAVMVTKSGPIADAYGPEIVYVNDAFQRTTGYSSEEAIGRSIGILRGPETSIEDLTELSETLRHGLPGHVELVNYRKDGTKRWIELNVNPVFDDGGVCTHFVSILRDITKRKLEEDRARALVENALDLILVLDPKRTIKWASPSVFRAVGYTSDELVGMDAAKLIHPDDLQFVASRMTEDFSHPGTGSSIECRWVRRDGSSFHAESTLNNLLHNPQIKGIVLNVHDITERKETEKLEEQLRQSQKLEAVGQLAGGIAHDFNNLLSVIQSYARFVMESLDESDPAKQDAREIVEAGERAATLVRQLLTFSRKEMATDTIINVNDIIEVTKKLLQRTIGEDVRLVTNLAPDLAGTKIDPANVEQMVMNIALNARDAMSQGGALTIKTRNISIFESSGANGHLSPGEYVSVVLSDTGRGIPQEIVDRIFEPFFTTKSRGQGTGLGLAMVYGMVQQAGGSISIRSEVGTGTTFEILLPATEETADTSSDGGPIGPQSGVGTILVVEDDVAVRRLVKRILTKAGYTVLGSSSGIDALQICEMYGATIDLLLTDVVMPGMSGQALAESIRLDHPSLPVLFMSGYPGDTVATRGELEGSDEYLLKPFTSVQLLEKVRNSLTAAVEIDLTPRTPISSR
jgi:two-component system, cell cycle sensor histidine kinase and response regulator CckA